MKFVAKVNGIIKKRFRNGSFLKQKSSVLLFEDNSTK